MSHSSLHAIDVCPSPLRTEGGIQAWWWSRCRCNALAKAVGIIHVLRRQLSRRSLENRARAATEQRCSGAARASDKRARHNVDVYRNDPFRAWRHVFYIVHVDAWAERCRVLVEKHVSCVAIVSTHTLPILRTVEGEVRWRLRRPVRCQGHAVRARGRKSNGGVRGCWRHCRGGRDRWRHGDASASNAEGRVNRCCPWRTTRS